MTTLDDRITAVFREFFANDDLELTDQTTFSDIPGWDSVAHVNLINALEAEFGTKFSVRDIMKMNSVAGIRQVVAAKTAT
jgi:acyl carrier protein